MSVSNECLGGRLIGVVSAFFVFGTPAMAASVDDLSYVTNGAAITITDCALNASGELLIPAEIDLFPVTEIGASAFRDCTALEQVILPPSITHIGDYAFRNCDALGEFTVPGGVSNWGVNIFRSSDGLTNVVIESGATDLAVGMFQYCGNLAQVSIPGSVTNLAKDAFYGCETLSAITIPNSVSVIGEQAFYGCEGLLRVDLPSGLSRIEYGTFYQCIAMTNAVIPSTVTYIGGSAFKYCYDLEDVTIPEAVTTIGYESFVHCESLKHVQIPDGVTDLTVAFVNCPSLTNVVIGTDLTYLHGNNFTYCSNLTAVVVAPSNTAFTSLDGVLFNKDMTTLVMFPDGKPGDYSVPGTVADIKASAFEDAERLTKIETSVFSYCPNLTSIEIPLSVTSIGNSAFSHSGLQRIDLHSGVTDIGNDAFNANNLEEVTLHEGLESIGSRAFAYCPLLKSITIPSTVDNLGAYGAAYCGTLTNATFNGNVPATLGSAPFASASAEFKVFCYDGAIGFTTPLWNGYPCEFLSMKSFGTWINAIIDPNQTKPADTPAGDGIPNLLKYAAGLEPETGYNETNLYTYAWEGSELVVTYYQATNTVGVGLSPIVAETLMDDWSNEGIVPVNTGAFDALGRAVMEVRLPCDDSTGFLRMGAIHY